MKNYYTTDGKTCRECNPYDPAKDNSNPYDPQDRHTPYDDFEAAAVLYHLTKEMPIGEFKGEEVWQYQYIGSEKWLTSSRRDTPPSFIGWGHRMYQDYDAATRIAIQPIEKPLEGEETPVIPNAGIQGTNGKLYPISPLKKENGLS